jgi:gamma-glutamyltranspeptidase
MPQPAIATPHADATEAGRRAFAAGGTAVDAALAAAAVLTVVYPHNCALGGDLFALVREADGTITDINASGPAPAGADAEALRARGLRAMPITGPDTVTVPGLVAGWGAVQERGGALPWAALLRDAIAAARDGVAVARSVGDALAEADLADPGMAAVFAPGGAPLRAGDTLRQPALAATLERLAAGGPRAFYEGDLAERLAAGARAAGCALSAADLAAFVPQAGPPLRAAFDGVEVLTSAPNSSGVLLLQALLALEAAAAADPLGADAAVLAELLRGGGQDRDRLLGDPRAVDVDLDAFLGARRIEALVADARAAARGEQGAPVLVQRHERPTGDTVAVVATDAEGRAVSLIQSLFHSFGSGILEPSTGVLLHNRGSFFSLRPGHPNALAPGRRPVHTLMPVLVQDGDGALLGALGTMGGRVQAQIHAQVLLRLRAGATPQEAVDAPRWIVGGMELGEPDDTVRIEDGVAGAARASLQAGRGADRVVDLPRDSEWLGHAQAIWAGAAGSDRRADA